MVPITERGAVADLCLLTFGGRALARTALGLAAWLWMLTGVWPRRCDRDCARGGCLPWLAVVVVVV